MHAYVAALAVTAVALVGAVFVVAEATSDRAWLAALIAVLVAAENVLAVRLNRGAHGESVAHEEALIVLGALLLSPAVGLAAFAVGTLAGQLTRRVTLKTAFNVAQLVGAAALAFLVVAALAPAGAADERRLVAALLGVLAYSIANRLAVAGVLALVGAARLRANLREQLGRGALLVWGGTIAVGVLGGLAGSAYIWALPVALVAMVALSIAFSGHARARSAHQAQREILQATPTAIFSIDPDGIVRTWNPQMERVSGFPAEEAAGEQLVELLGRLGLRGDGAIFSPAAEWAAGRRETIRLEAHWLVVSRANLPDGGFAFAAQDITAERESEQRLRLALDAGYMGHWDWDLDSGAVRWSENLERICGLEPGSFGGTYEDFLAVIHPDDRAAVDAATGEAMETGHEELVYRIVRPDRTVRWLEDKGLVVRDDDGRIRGMSGVAFDVTARRQAELMSDLQRAVLESVAAGAPLEVTLERLVRLVEEQAEGALASIFLLDANDATLRRCVAPSLPPSYTQAVDGVAVGPVGPSCGVAAFRRERVITSDIARDPLWVEWRSLALEHGLRACSSTPLLDSDGELLGTFAVYHAEPTAPPLAQLELSEVASHLAGVAIERARQEQRLVKAEEKYRRLVEQLPLAVYSFKVADRDGELRAVPRYVSPQVEKLLGYSASDWLDDPDLYSAILHPEDRERVHAEVHRARAAGNRFRLEYRMVAKGGQVVWVHDESVYVRGQHGEVVAVEGFLLDVTDRRQLESKLLHAQKMDAVGRLAGGIAHDFNNLMSGVIGFGGLVLADLTPADPHYEQIEQIVRAGERAATLTSQLLMFSKKQILHPRVLDLNAVVVDSERLLRRLIGEDIELVCELAPGLGPVLADTAQLEQIVVNLAVNARDAMPTGGRLTIATADVEVPSGDTAALGVDSGQYVRLSVVDTGRGMDAETRERIFDPFFTTKGEIGGTGLGLSTVLGIVEQSGGQISVESELGCGTTFTILLPRAEGDRPDGRENSHRRADSAQCGRETILLVEDEDLVRDLERQVLERCGYTVLTAGRPEEAIEIASTCEGPIHLLLTDVVMPGLNGRELVERLATARPDMRVLYASGYNDDSIVRHGVLEDEVALITKPFAPNALAARVREVLDGVPGARAATAQSRARSRHG